MFLAEASLTFSVSPEVAFDKLVDFSSWKDWMPRSFRPARSSITSLHVGDRLRIYIAGAPFASPIKISVVDRAREIAWCGGPRGVLRAEHRFVFEPHEHGTLVRSVESWRGVLTPILRAIVKPAAERVGREQLAGLAHALSS